MTTTYWVFQINKAIHKFWAGTNIINKIRTATESHGCCSGNSLRKFLLGSNNLCILNQAGLGFCPFCHQIHWIFYNVLHTGNWETGFSLFFLSVLERQATNLSFLTSPFPSRLSFFLVKLKELLKLPLFFMHRGWYIRIPVYIKHPAVRVLLVTNKNEWLCGFFFSLQFSWASKEEFGCKILPIP